MAAIVSCFEDLMVDLDFLSVAISQLKSILRERLRES